jgi:HEAT repeat protein
MKSFLCSALVLVVTVAAADSVHAAAPPLIVGGPHPSSAVNRARVKVLLRKLDDDSFFTRQRADENLRALGKAVVPLLRAERERTTSFEVRERLDRMLGELTFDEQVPDLVRLLGHANLQFRDHAEAVLLRAGSSILPLLKQQRQGELSAEGRTRLEKVIAALSATAPPVPRLDPGSPRAAPKQPARMP